MQESQPDTPSHWTQSRARSLYHFDPSVMDPRWDTVQGLGRFAGDWSASLAQAISMARPVNWATRQFSPIAGQEVSPFIQQEEYDLAQAGADPKMTIFRLVDGTFPEFERMVELTGLNYVTTRLHVQFPGEVFTMHIDQLQVNRRAPLENIVRLTVMLTDWRPGHFFQYGNYSYERWRAGDIHTFDWQHVPHCTANASLEPRASILITGTICDRYRNFVKQARSQESINIA